MPIMLGQKTVECRSWRPSYRGPILVCSTKQDVDGCVGGHALCVVDLVSVEPYRAEHDNLSLLDFEDVPDGSFAWVLDNVRMVRPFSVSGKQRLFDVPDELVEVVGAPSKELVCKYVFPLVYRPRGSEADDIWGEVFESLGWA